MQNRFLWMEYTQNMLCDFYFGRRVSATETGRFMLQPGNLWRHFRINTTPADTQADKGDSESYNVPSLRVELDLYYEQMEMMYL